MKVYSPFKKIALLTITLLSFIAADSNALILEPGHLIYGVANEDTRVISLKIDDEEIASYTMGSNPLIGDYYVLRVPIDTIDPQEPGTARPGDVAYLYIDEETEPVRTLTIGERGTGQICHLNATDTDLDGLLDGEEEIANTNPANPDSDGDGLLDGAETNSDPTLADTDGDGYMDGYEVAAGTDPDDNSARPVFYVDRTNNSGIEDGSQENPYNTITEAVTAAPALYTVQVASGTYQEQIILNKELRLVGNSAASTFLDAGGNGSVITFSEISGEMSSIEHFTILNGETGIDINDASPLVRNNIITQMTVSGVACTAGSAATIVNNTIAENIGATGISANSAPVVVVNNIVSDNGQGISCSVTPTAELHYNNVWNNSIANYTSCPPGSTDTSSDPGFVDSVTNDFRLRIHSTSIDAGDPMEKLTLDSSINDSTITVDIVTNIVPGERIWITDGASEETDTVITTTATTLELSATLLNSYTTFNNAHIYSAMSYCGREPEISRWRIDQGAFGNTANGGGNIPPADVDGSGTIDITDLILTLQILVATETVIPVYQQADVNHDNTIGITEAIFILQTISEQ